MNIRVRAGLALLAVVAATAACSTNSPADASSDAILAPYGLAGLDARAVIDRLEAMPVSARPSNLKASVRPGELLLTDLGSGAQATLDIPDDVFYLAIAPYVEATHECFYHSLTTCRGELSGQDVHVTITRADGQLLVDETRTAYGDGFVGFWLPRDIDASLRIEHAGLAASTAITTGSDDPTCLTTLRLA